MILKAEIMTPEQLFKELNWRPFPEHGSSIIHASWYIIRGYYMATVALPGISAR